MKSESDDPRISTRLWVRTASVHSQASKRRGRLPKGSLLALLENMMSVNGPLTRLYSLQLPGLVRGRLHSAIIRAMKPRSGSASLALTSWFT